MSILEKHSSFGIAVLVDEENFILGVCEARFKIGLFIKV